MKNRLNKILLTLLALVGVSLPAAASYLPFNTSVNMNVGIGTSTPQGALTVMNGNVGIGTWAPGALLTVNGSSILGVPASSADSITASGIGALAGGYANHIAQAGIISASQNGSFAFGSANGGAGSNSSILATNSGSIAMGYATQGGTVEATALGAVAMGYTLGPSSIIEATANGAIAMGYANVNSIEATGLGSVAIGQNVEALSNNAFALGQGVVNPNPQSFMVGFSAVPTLTVTATGVGIGTSSPFGGGLIVLPANTGNVGIGSLAPGQALDVNGTVRTTGLTLTGNGAANGNVLVGNSIGVGTWMPASTLPGSGGGTNYWLNDTGNIGINTTYNIGVGTIADVNTLNILGNVGIGTISGDKYLTTPAPKGGMIVGGNVGLGTWAPAGKFQVGGSSASPFLIDANGNVGIGTTQTSSNALTIMNGNVGIGTWATPYIGNSAKFVIEGALGGSADLFVAEEVGGPFVHIDSEATLGAVDSRFGEISPFGNDEAIVFDTGLSGPAVNTSGNEDFIELSPTYDEISGTTSNTDLLINRIETALGSGNQYFLDLQATGIDKFVINNKGNVGIGTSNPFGGNLIVNGGGNVGIGSLTPGQALDVKGTVRMTGLTLTGNGAGNGNVLVGNSVGVGTWMPASTLATSGVSSNYWLNDTGNVGINTTYNIGVGTISAVNTMNILGNIGIGTSSNDPYMKTKATNGGMIISGNVGIGTWAPGNSLEIAGGNIGIGTTFSLNGIGTTSTILTLHGDTSSVYLGWQSGASASGGGANAAVGFQALANGGLNNTALGYQALNASASAADTAVGEQALVNSNGIHETALGRAAGGGIVGGGSNVNSHDSLYLGSDTLALADGDTDEIVIGAAAVGIGSYSVVLGESNIARTQLQGNVGIGTATPQGGLVVTNGNVGVGTWTTAGGQLILRGRGNVGIGSAWPGTVLDVNGTTRMTGLTLTGNGAANGNVLVGNSVGVGTWMPASTLGGASSQWTTTNVNDVFLPNSGNVGIGTSFTNGGAALAVMNGNVGIGTWAPSQALYVNGNMVIANTIFSANSAAQVALNSNNATLQGGNVYLSGSSVIELNGHATIGPTNIQNIIPQGGLIVQPTAGNVGIGTWAANNNTLTVAGNIGLGTGLNSPYLTTSAPIGGMIIEGNIGLGSLAPGQKIDVQGTVRTTGLTLTGNGAANGNVLVGNSVGVGTWMPASTLPGSGGGTNFWNYSAAGNIGVSTIQAVGIGTSFIGGTGEAALSVMNGNVGIGTWVPGGGLVVMNGNVGIGLANPGAPLDVYFGTNNGEFYTSNLGFNSIKIGNQAAGGLGFFTNNTVSMELGGNGGLSLGSTYFSTDPGSGNMIVQGNVGIGSLHPGTVIDVNGTVRTTGFTLTGNGAANGNILVGNSVGVGTWMPASTLATSSGSNYWLKNAGANVGISTAYAVGIGTTFVGGTGEASFAVMNGNVGIGTWVPGSALRVLGSVGIGALDPWMELTVTSPGFPMAANIFSESVFDDPTGSFGVWLGYDSTGTIGVVGSDENGSTSILALATANSSGVEIERMWLDGAGNIGIGTITPAGGLAVMNGNVGIGTWVPGTVLSVIGSGPTHFSSPSGIVAQNGISLFNDGVLSNPQISSTTMEVVTSLGSSSTIFRWGPGYVNSGSVSGYLGYTGGGAFPNVNVTASNADLDLGVGAASTAIVIKSATGNVGIGSTTPGQTLDVQGTARMTGFTLTGNGAANGNVLVGNGVGIGTWMPASTLPGSGSGTNYWLNDTGNVGISTAYAVGIGTISQINTLNILGNIGIGTFSFDPYMKTKATNGGMIISGNVGIGTWVPMAALQIGANSLSGNGPPPQLFLGTFSSGAGYPQLVGNWNNNTDWGIGQATASVTDNAILLGVTAAPNFAPFSWGSTGLNVLVSGNIGIGTITTTGMNTNLYVPTNVGIGTKSPQDILDVTGNPSSGDIAVFENTNVSSESDIGFRDNTGLAKLWIGYGNASEVAPYTGISFMEFDSPAFEITNNNGAGLSEYFTSTGNVGIGTFSLLSKFNVNGGVGIGTTLTNSAYISGNSAPSGGLIVQGNVGIGTFNPFGGGLIVLPANTGNVGIGSATPGQMLDVQGTIRVLGGLVNGNVGIGTTFINGTGESALTVMNGNVGIGTWAGGGALVVMNGNVGIGTTNPTYQLAVGNNAFIKTSTQNKSTYMEVSYGTGAGASANFVLPATTFTKINFHSLTGYTLTDNGGNYSATNDFYVTPVAGTYMIITKFRVTDATTQFISYGQGSGTAAADSPTFLWQQTVTTTASRNGSQNALIKHYAAGSDVEMFAYANSAINSSDGDFTIYLLTAD